MMDEDFLYDDPGLLEERTFDARVIESRSMYIWVLGIEENCNGYLQRQYLPED